MGIEHAAKPLTKMKKNNSKMIAAAQPHIVCKT